MRTNHKVGGVILVLTFLFSLEIFWGINYIKRDADVAYTVYYANIFVSIVAYLFVTRFRKDNYIARSPLILIALLSSVFTKLLLFYGNVFTRDIPTLLSLIDALKTDGVIKVDRLSRYQEFYWEHPGLIIWGTCFEEISGLNNYGLMYSGIVTLQVAIILSFAFFATVTYRENNAYLVILLNSVILGVLDPLFRLPFVMPAFFIVLSLFLKINESPNKIPDLIVLILLVFSTIIAHELSSFIISLFAIIALISPYLFKIMISALHVIGIKNISNVEDVNISRFSTLQCILLIPFMLFSIYEIYRYTTTLDIIELYLKRTGVENLGNLLIRERDVRQWVVFYARWLFVSLSSIVALHHIIFDRACKSKIYDFALLTYVLLLIFESLYTLFIPTKSYYYTYIILTMLLLHSMRKPYVRKPLKFIGITALLLLIVHTTLMLPPNFVSPLEVHKEIYDYGDFSYFFKRSELLASMYVSQNIDPAGVKILSDLDGQLLFYSYGFNILGITPGGENIEMYKADSKNVIIFWRTPDMDYMYPLLLRTVMNAMNLITNYGDVKVYGT
jgi:hypothetical protein